MKTGLIIGLAAVGVGFLALTSVARADEAEEETGTMATRKQRFWRRLETISELDNTQRYFLTLVAQRESNYNPAAHNGSITERARALEGFNKNASLSAKVQGCGFSPASLASGSWGLFQRLAPYWVDDMFDIFGTGVACTYVDQSREVSNMNLQIVSAIKSARALQQRNGWKAYPTVGNLRLGWWSPTQMGYISKHAERIERYRADARKASLPEGIVDATIREFPNDYKGIYDRLGGAG